MAKKEKDRQTNIVHDTQHRNLKTRQKEPAQTLG